MDSKLRREETVAKFKNGDVKVIKPASESADVAPPAVATIKTAREYLPEPSPKNTYIVTTIVGKESVVRSFKWYRGAVGYVEGLLVGGLEPSEVTTQERA